MSTIQRSIRIGRAPRSAGLALIAAVGVLPAVGAASAGGAAPACGSVVTTSVRLTADLVDCPGNGLVVGAPDITIDLDGHTIDGVGTAAGIDNNGRHDRVRITGGTVTGFGRGLELLEMDGGRIDRMTLADNAVGLSLSRSRGVTVNGVEARDNASVGIEVTFSDGITVGRSVAAGNGHGGIVDRFSTGNRYERNVLDGNVFYGITLDSADGAVLAGNTAVANEFDGIQVGFRTADARLERNVAAANGANGIVVDEPGNTLARNQAYGNGEWGIAAPAGTVDGGRNRSVGNGAGDCTGVTCTP